MPMPFLTPVGFDQRRGFGPGRFKPLRDYSPPASIAAAAVSEAQQGEGSVLPISLRLLDGGTVRLLD